MRTLLAAAAAALALSACNPCQRMANAEAAATQKGKDCNASSSEWTSSQVQTCVDNLSQCTESDLKAMDTYSDCLQKLPTCASGQSISWGLQRVTCTQSLLNVSFNCASKAL